MENPNRIIGLVSEGLSPSQISKQCNASFDSVAQTIAEAVHAGQLLRSQVQSTLNKEWLREIGLFSRLSKRPPEEFHASLKQCGFDCSNLTVEELRFYLNYSGKEFRAGETYELLSEIERTLHRQIRQILAEELGSEETGWWREGVPEKVRVACVEARELDGEFSGDPAYSYTTLIHLKCIVEKGWSLFEKRLPEQVAKRKPDFMNDLKMLNGIRNKVMHPVRSAPPTEEDFSFVKRTAESLHLSKWRKKGAAKS